MFAIRDGRWKLVCGNGSGGHQAPKGSPFAQPFQLFDLQQDLGEEHDVASQHADVVQALTQRVDELRQTGR